MDYLHHTPLYTEIKSASQADFLFSSAVVVQIGAGCAPQVAIEAMLDTLVTAFGLA